MVAGNPLWSGEGDRAGFDRDVDFSVVDLARGIREVGCDEDRSLLGQGGGCEQSKRQ
jgi:hypothetical protein